ncbi:MAG TPA: dTMP kinase [Streptosporangiaceae bacterium]|nr:dTMP kinase [Streptosporangiaceae bacterium]
MSLRSPLGQHHDGVLSIRPFRRIWIATTLSSLGDWLSLLALSALAYSLTGSGHSTAGGLPTGSTTTGSVAVGGVWITSLLPYLLFGPLAGAVADKLDRRINMIVGDVVRAVLYLTIPINLVVGFAPKLTWLYVAQFLACCASLFWSPAKDASIPNLVPRDKLNDANGLSLLTTYGTAPVAALFFVVLQWISTLLGDKIGVHYFSHVATGQVALSLYFNTATFVISAITVYSLHLPKQQSGERISVPSVAKSIWEGWRFAGKNRTVRGITIGMLGAFAAAGVVVGLGYGYVSSTLNGGPTGWGFVFAAIFLGLAAGMSPAVKVLGDFSKRRLFGLAIAVAGLPLALIALIPNLPVVVVLVIVLGICAGMAYVTGYTIIGREVDDDTRGRTFAFLQSALRVVMFLVIAFSGLLAAGFSALVDAISGSPDIKIGHIQYASVGINFVLLLAAVVAVLLGWTSYRQMDDRPGVPLLPDLIAALRGHPLPEPPEGRRPAPTERATRRPHGHGLLLAFEGGEGAGKSTQATLLAIWLRENGYDVLATHEPGATKVGMRLRALLLDTAHTGLSPWAEALMYAGDRAEHVSAVIAPALARGTIVVTDRYVDSSLAYQGGGRKLPLAAVKEVNNLATGGLVPDLTILLDLPPSEGLGRRTRSADRLEAEPEQFHNRVRRAFLDLAHASPDRYLVLDATMESSQISKEIQNAVRELLPDPVPERAEEITGSIPVIRE